MNWHPEPEDDRVLRGIRNGLLLVVPAWVALGVWWFCT